MLMHLTEEIMPKGENKTFEIQDDYDSPWKEALEIYFTDFMEFFFPRLPDRMMASHQEVKSWEKPRD